MTASTPSQTGGKDASVTEVLVIGGGPGGYVAAIRAAQLGARVVLVEKDKMGGTCLNRGCIPTKTLLHSSEYIRTPVEADASGIELKYSGLDLKKLVGHKNRVVEDLRRGVEQLVKSNGIRAILGTARFINRHTVEVLTGEGALRIKPGKTIIATGSKSAPLPVSGSEHPAVINSDKALNIGSVPQKIIIVGGGAVGVEFAFLYHNLGAQVAVVEMMPQLLPQMDEEVASILQMTMKQRGIEVFTGAKVECIEEAVGRVSACLSVGSKAVRLDADQILAAIGRVPETEALNLGAAGVKMERHRIAVNASMETCVQGIFAVGDVAGRCFLAHSASAEGVIAAENAMGSKSEMDYKVVPGCIYTSPEVAGVGLTEREAREKGYNVSVGKFPFAALGKAAAIGSKNGLAKIVAEKELGEILGVHIIGERATDLIAEAALAIRLDATVEELTSTIHAHPTFSEALFEAAHAVHKRAIHLPGGSM